MSTERKIEIEYTVRRMAKDDYPYIPSVYASSFNEPPWDENWHSIPQFDENAVWVAVCENKICGFLISFYSDEFSFPYISVAAVAAPHKNCGIGSALVKKAVSYWKSKGYTTMLVHTDTFRADARALYKKCGFVETETADDGTITLISNI